ncbi:hypothetical protein BDZ89DRAFT_918269, partial [Hymenopellis radicata]
LESCILKMFTRLVDQRICQWMDVRDIVPETQNGFRKGFHALNNPFVLRAAIELALAEKKTLYVIFPDLSNAFPWTDHSSLWSMMYHKGIAGPMFD